MTKQEAINRLKYDREMCYFDPTTGRDDSPYNKDCEEMAKALDLAIDALQREVENEKSAMWFKHALKQYILLNYNEPNTVTGIMEGWNFVNRGQQAST